jgi:DNA-directed RNA polymerase I subunit RPA1
MPSLASSIAFLANVLPAIQGKRVNYAARSVISPDVNIETNEIGVPPIFARKLTFPEPVTAHNIHLMRQAVINGPNVHPGASYIQMEDGHLLSLVRRFPLAPSRNVDPNSTLLVRSQDRMTEEERTAQANKLLAPDSRASSSRLDRPDVGLPQTRTAQINRKVYRHLQDGDIVILNRQPTLHKPSMMCHRVRVLKGEKTIRMHYANW